MQSTQRWSASLFRSKWLFSAFRIPHSLPKILVRRASSIPAPPVRHSNFDDARRRRKPKVWERESDGQGLSYLEPRVKPRRIEDDKSGLIDTNSLLNTLVAHQKANAQQIEIKEIATDASSLWVSKIGDWSYKRMALEKENTLEVQGPLDYEGKPRPLALDWEIIGDVPRYLRLPWMKELDAKGASTEPALQRLKSEIQAADTFFSPTAEEADAAQRALSDIESCVKKATKGLERLDLIGSRASGLATALSDLDLNFVPKDSVQQPHTSPLTKVWRHIRFVRPQGGPILASYYAKQARVPIIVGTHGSTGLEFQIQNATTGYGSLELVKGLRAEWPTLQALFKVLKQALQMRGLCKGQHGGITSYPLLNMIVVSLKLHQGHTNPHDSSKQLLEFLRFWSEIDFYATGITHHPSKYLWSRLGKYDKENPLTAFNAIDLITQDPIAAIPVQFDVRKNLIDIHEGRDHFRMTLHDPANPYNDLGRSAHLIKHIQATFMVMHEKLKEDMSNWDQRIRVDGQAEVRPVSLLRSLIEGDYSIYNMHRRRLCPPKQEGTNG
ncbi:hypothetical protein H2198_000888 [Neophaeococcomyces mojaviensis]|uniref:Uncharacterized protein n=1 Tax=Neophaeococcomyces mojaviensis TaxID=3383035 RepID=A0ACC3AJB0_9EURO|nr:hypothetical protein H2198_000888 [Knufia sp. JES_112]